MGIKWRIERLRRDCSGLEKAEKGATPYSLQSSPDVNLRELHIPEIAFSSFSRSEISTNLSGRRGQSHAISSGAFPFDANGKSFE